MDATGIDWDRWRQDYAATSLEEQQAFYSEVWRDYPIQSHFDYIAAARAVQDVKPRTVVEVGGWDGALAEQMLTLDHGIKMWANVEICREASAIAATRHPRLESLEMTEWYWERDWNADLFVASHSIEHMTADQLRKTIEATDTPALYLDAPLETGPTNWAGYIGSHILEVGWDGVDEICKGYEVAWRTPCDASEARLYLRS